MIRSSWHRLPIDGIGREWGIDRGSPFCSRLNRIPAATRACFENGGVFTSPCSHTSGLSFPATFIRTYQDVSPTMSDPTSLSTTHIGVGASSHPEVEPIAYMAPDGDDADTLRLEAILVVPGQKFRTR